MNLDHEFVQVSKLSEDPKKLGGLHQKWTTFFARIQMNIYAQIYTRVKLLGEIIGGYIPPHNPPLGFGNPASRAER